jgi:thiol-disulfide isomerase/thioredoxin
MPSFSKVVGEVVRPYYNYIIAGIAFIFFAVLAYFIYKNVFSKKKKNIKFDDVANANNRKGSIDIFFFFVDWCPHCKTAKPEWDQFKRNFNNSTIGDNVVKCYDINCTDDNGEDIVEFDNSDPDNPVQTGIKPTSMKTTELIKLYNIDAYPTIKLKKDDIVVDFDAKITQVALSKFVNSV